ncbi:oligosaccharide repeat unit polymerase [Waterburya agarophytonicola K14]|uniref:Oligosaccharide repeat unit polymerase n=1 Tax=Waterburya agarophytonicola KI4 TaxID=2874699 RepID=A0A964FEY9_9CYAN|nr:O-antigen polymerase [Waterburya agarophytonicola]MCC0176427.1 oligosaccharide repeat unit polymerase [Waterburya agarophytonicola KI4]
MAVLEYPVLLFAQIILIIVSLYWLIRRNDVVPLLVSSFLFYVASYRYWSVTSDLGRWVNVTAFLSDNPEVDGLNALACIIFGQICLLSTYWYCQKQAISVSKAGNDNSLLTWLRPKVLFLGLLCFPLVIATRSGILAQINSGKSAAFEISGYLYLFPMVLIGIAVLTITLWKFGGLPSTLHKLLATVILIGVFYLTFSPASRFQFIGWIVASAIILSSSFKPQKRLWVFSIAAVVGLGLFAFAGAMRNVALSEVSLEQAAIARAMSAEDGNMLDGFVIVRSLFPKHLDFRYGMEHLEILMRPIPRSLWAGKPVGGSYMEYLGLSDASTGMTVGFSPTLFGSFYIDGGIFGIVSWSLIYGWALAKITTYSIRLKPFAGVIVRAVVCACLIPLLRGGDLPGIYAWVGMAFWPCFLLLWIKRRELNKARLIPKRLLLQHYR